MPIRVVSRSPTPKGKPVRGRGRPANATTALIPAAARSPEVLSSHEAALNSQAIETFTKAVGGRTQLAEVLAVTAASPDIEKIATLILDPRYAQISLRRLCTLAGITVADLFSAYKKAMLTRAHIEATHIIAAKLPPIVDDVMTRAAPQRLVCPACLGTSAVGQGPCGTCQSTGHIQTEPDLDRQKLALELGHLTEKKGGLVMQQNTIAAGALASTGSGALEQLHQAVGDLLFSPQRRRSGAPVVEPVVEAIAEPPSDDRPRTDPREPPWPLPTPEPEEPEEPDDDDENGGGGQFGAQR